MAKRKSITGSKKRRKPSAAVLLPPRQRDPQNRRLIIDNISGHGSLSSQRIGPRRLSTTSQGSSSSAQASRKRKRNIIDDFDADTVGLPRTKFAVLKPRSRYVPQNVIRSRWRVLPELVQYKVKEIFRSLERPVITSQGDEGRRIEAQVAVASITRTLGRRLPRMPFPPGTKEVHFNYEALLDSNRLVEAQLDPAIHSIALCKSEIEKEAHLLAEEKQNLEALEKNARTEESVYKRHASQRHILLHSEGVVKGEHGLDPIGFVEKDAGMTTHLDQQHVDVALKPLVSQLHNHLDSMQSNTAETKGISEALLRAKTALDDLLYSRIDTEHYAMVASA